MTDPTERGAAARYRAILRRPGVTPAIGWSVLGRLHESMISFALILLVTRSGTYAQAGVVLAAYGAGAVVSGPVNARLADRFGHTRVLLVTAVGYGAAMVAVAWAAGDVVLLGVVSAITGLGTPPLTPALRSALPRMVGPDQRLTAFALESTLQEAIYVVGPVLAGAVAVLAGPERVLHAAALATVAGTAGYCLAVRRLPAAGGEEGPVLGHPREVLTRPVLRLLVGGAGFLLMLSIVAVALIAQVSGPRAHGSAGVFLAATSAGSMVGGLVFGARVRRDASLRLRYASVGGAIGALTGVAAGTGAGTGVGAALLGVAAFAYGTMIAPLATVLFGRLDEVAGERRSTQAFGWMGAAMGVGAMAGDAAGGWLVTATAPWTAFLVAGGVALATATVVPGRADDASGPDA